MRVLPVCFELWKAGIFLAVIGVVWSIKAASTLLQFTFKTFLRPGKSIKKLGEWAVVTGATDGIGLALAKEIAKKGVNVVLVSRSAEKLKAAEQEIKAKCPKVETKTISFDFSNGAAADYAKLAAELKSLPIGLLYNNVGVSYDHAELLQVSVSLCLCLCVCVCVCVCVLLCLLVYVS